MAERKITANTWLLMIDTAGGTAYDTVVCLTDWSFPRSRAEIDSKSFCGPDKSVGQLESGPIDFSGITMLGLGTVTVSTVQLDVAFKANTTIGWKIAPAVPITGDLIYSGTGALSKLDDSASTDDNPKFSAAISIFGLYTTTVFP